MIVHSFFSYVIVIVSLASIYSSYKLTLKANNNVKLPTVGLFYLFKFLVIIYIGTVLMNFYIPTIDFKKEHVEIFGFALDRVDGFNQDMYLLQRPDFLLLMWFLATSSLYLVPGGMLLYNYIFRIKPIPYDDIEYKNNEAKGTIFFVIIFFILGLVVFYLYSIKLEKIPILAVFEGYDRDMISYFRSQSGNAFQGKHHWYDLFMHIIPVFLLFMLFIKLVYEKVKDSQYYFALVLFLFW